MDNLAATGVHARRRGRRVRGHSDGSGEGGLASATLAQQRRVRCPWNRLTTGSAEPWVTSMARKARVSAHFLPLISAFSGHPPFPFAL